MRGRILRHLGGLAGVAAIATGLAFGAGSDAGDAAPPREAPAVEEARALEAAPGAADERPCFVVPACARVADTPRATAGGGAGGAAAAGRTWRVLVVGPDEEPVAGVRVSVQFVRTGNTSYVHSVGDPVELTSDAAGRAETAVPDRARLAWLSAEAPEGWIADAGAMVGRGDPFRAALRRVRLARSEAARQAARTDFVRGADGEVDEVTVRLGRFANVSGRVEVPEGFPPARVRVVASWNSALDGAEGECSAPCGSDGSFQLPVPAGAGPVAIDAFVVREESPSPPVPVPREDKATAVFLCRLAGRPQRRPSHDDAAPQADSPADWGRPGLVLLPARVTGLAPGASGVRLVLAPVAPVTLDVFDPSGSRTRAERIDVADGRGGRWRADVPYKVEGAIVLVGLTAGEHEIVVSGSAGSARVRIHLPAAEPIALRLAHASLVGRLEGHEGEREWRLEWWPDPPGVARVDGYLEEDGSFQVDVEPGIRGTLFARTTDDGPDPRWTRADGVAATDGPIVLRARPGMRITGRVVGLPKDHPWRPGVRWESDVWWEDGRLENGDSFQLDSLVEGVGAVELWWGKELLVRWPRIPAGATDLVLRFPSPDDPSDAPGLVAEVGFTQDPGGR